MRSFKLRYVTLPLGGLALATAGIFTACGGGLPDGPQGGPVTGAADMHCVADDGGVIAQETDQSACNERPPDAMPADANPVDAGPDEDYGDTMYNQAGDDDDCKYHVTWTASPIFENYDTTFHIVATTKTDGQPATGADPFAEILLSSTHGAPPTDQHATETSPGHYDIGPVQFDAPGMWTVRFHLYENCLDLVDESPHGHAAFYVQVP